MNYFSKFLVLITSIAFSVYFTFLTIISRKQGVDKNSNFVVSLTTYGKRLPFVYLTIESILRQQCKPYKIILVLCLDECTELTIPFFLRMQMKRGLELKFVKENYKSYKKLSYILDSEIGTSQYVITADDDVFYPSWWILKFEEFIKNHNGYNSILCFRGRIIKFDTYSIGGDYSKWVLADSGNVVDNNLIPTGVSGVCYPLISINEIVFDFENITKYCPYADDIWYKLMTTKNGFKSKLVTDRSLHFTPIITGFQKGLERLNVQSNLNTHQFNASINFFNLDKNDFYRK